MKRLFTVCVVLATFVLLLAGCGTGDTDKGTISSSVTINDATVTLGGVYDDALAGALGTPTDTQQAVSCHYDGYDTMYYYDGYTIYTYLLEEQKIMYSIEITDADIKTPEGAAVGMSLTDVEKIYGTEYTELPNGISYALKDEGAKLNFRLKDDAVFCIEYYTE